MNKNKFSSPIEKNESIRLVERYRTRANGVFWARIGLLSLWPLVALNQESLNNHYIYYFTWLLVSVAYTTFAYKLSAHKILGRWIYFLTLCLDIIWLTYFILKSGALFSPLMVIIPVFTLFFIILFHNPITILPPLLILPIVTILGKTINQTQGKVFFVLALYSVLNAIVIYLTSYSLSNEESQTRQIFELQQKLKGLAILQERNRIAREIHDGVGAYLSGIIIQSEFLLSLVEEGKVRQEISELKTSAEEAIDEVRRALAIMKAKFDFESQLKNLNQVFFARYKLPLNLKIMGTLPNLSDHEYLTLFRILQECLNNIVKHAQATQANLIIKTNEDKIQIKISDNGIGFEALQSKQNNYGLTNIRERAKQLGAEVTIDSIKNFGTTIKLRLPLKTFS